MQTSNASNGVCVTPGAILEPSAKAKQVRSETLRSVELLRFLAAFSVVLAHMISAELRRPIFGRFVLPGDAQLPGTIGVEFFFVLSGMVMWLAHGRELGAPAGRAVAINAAMRFGWRRCCRIYPLYWLLLAESLTRLWPVDFAHLADWIILAPNANPSLPLVAWTLRQEIAFYLVFGLALLPWLGRCVLPLWGIGVFAVNLGIVAGPPAWAVLLFSQFVIEFLIGLAVGWALSRRRTGSPGRGLWCVGGGLLLLAIEIVMHRWGMEYGGLEARVGYGLAYALILFGVVSLERVGRLRLGAWTLVAGTASYPLYLSHLAVMDHLAPILASHVAALGIGGVATIMTLATACVALLLGYLVDRPL